MSKFVIIPLVLLALVLFAGVVTYYIIMDSQYHQLTLDNKRKLDQMTTNLNKTISSHTAFEEMTWADYVAFEFSKHP